MLVRDTQAYSNMLRESFHPDLLRDALDRDRFFDHLWGKAASHPETGHGIPGRARRPAEGRHPDAEIAAGVAGDLEQR